MINFSPIKQTESLVNLSFDLLIHKIASGRLQVLTSSEFRSEFVSIISELGRLFEIQVDDKFEILDKEYEIEVELEDENIKKWIDLVITNKSRGETIRVAIDLMFFDQSKDQAGKTDRRYSILKSVRDMESAEFFDLRFLLVGTNDSHYAKERHESFETTDGFGINVNDVYFVTGGNMPSLKFAKQHTFEWESIGDFHFLNLLIVSHQPLIDMVMFTNPNSVKVGATKWRQDRSVRIQLVHENQINDAVKQFDRDSILKCYKSSSRNAQALYNHLKAPYSQRHDEVDLHYDSDSGEGYVLLYKSPT